jgi:hypothetical protein
MENELLTEQIDAYLNGTLKGDDFTNFQQRYAQDEDFRQSVEAQRLVRTAIQKIGKEDLKAQLKNLHQELYVAEKEKVTPIFSLQMYWKYAVAVCVVVMIASVTFWLYRQTPEKEATALQIPTQKIVLIEKNNETLGYAGEKIRGDSIIVQIIDNQQYILHYEFIDTLKIYANQVQFSDIKIEYNAQNNGYQLFIKDKNYTIEKGFKGTQPLR